eukprot:CAMPEP_0117429492 /NCGR_PEP_ID=MMETSP0758-20121206/9049_1 /TAXON_ID=63605 /ORGANISM="Percolomonas cosmopolitus, Strain AE-1 (ATCC 50343)" /LENGTH=272 /DNA_ID=CAMNT_0005216601 /DNA_START=61 /DNA_END=879 /DNA_ORIENTATION=-
MVEWTNKDVVRFFKENFEGIDISSIEGSDLVGNDLLLLEADDLVGYGINDEKLQQQIILRIQTHLEADTLEEGDSFDYSTLKHPNTEVFSLEKLVEKYGEREVYGNVYLFYSAPQIAFIYNLYFNPQLLREFFNEEQFDKKFYLSMILAPQAMIINSMYQKGYLDYEPNLSTPLLLAFALNFIGWMVAIFSSRGTKVMPVAPMDFIGTYIMVFHLLPNFLLDESYLRYALWACAVLTVPKQFVAAYFPYKASMLSAQAKSKNQEAKSKNKEA